MKGQIMQCAGQCTVTRGTCYANSCGNWHHVCFPCLCWISCGFSWPCLSFSLFELRRRTYKDLAEDAGSVYGAFFGQSFGCLGFISFF